VNTTEEIRVYNDFIDTAYFIYLCRLDMDSPDSYFKYKDKYTKREYDDYKRKYMEHKKSFDNMLDTLNITALVPDSLMELNYPSQYIREDLDSSQNASFRYLLNDTTHLKPASYCVDSLKSNKIFFEQIPQNISKIKYLDWDKMSIDTMKKYEKQLNSFWVDHYGSRIVQKYYIGVINMSRVKFNHDSTLCILECGHTAAMKCGYGFYYLLKKENDKWIIVKRIGSWIS